MAKNRKNQSAAVRFGPALKAIVLCVMIGGAGVGYVWQKSQIGELAHQIKQRELKLKALGDQNTQLREQLAKVCSPVELIKQMQKFKLGMAMPQANQVWPLPEPVLVPAATVGAPGQAAASSPEAGLAMH